METRGRKLFILLLLATTATVAMAQGVSVTGTVVDERGDGLWRATVAMISESDTLRTLTGENGQFALENVATGQYELTVTSVGFDTLRRDVSVDGPVELGMLRVKDSSHMLEGVTVMAQYETVKPSGETVIRVKGNPLARGTTTQDFLRMIRDITVTDNSISIRGRSGTLVYIDDRPSSYEQLKNIPPTMIERIEIMPHADASYGVNATGGVVKVYLRTDGGVLGSLSFLGSANKDGVTQATPYSNILYTRNKLSVSNYIVFTPHFRNYDKNKQTYTYDDGRETTTDNNGLTRVKQVTENLSLRYRFNKHDRIDIYGGFYHSATKSKQNSTDDNGHLRIASRPKTRSLSAGIQLRKALGNDGKNWLNLRTEYGNDYSNGMYDYVNNGTADAASQRSRLNSISVLPQVHFELKNNMTVNAGLDYYYLMDRYNNRGTRILNYINDENYSNMGNDYGAWADFSATLWQKLYVRAALNYHGTWSRYRDYNNHDNDVRQWQDGIYPSLSAQWTINSEKSRYLSIGYRHYYSLPNYNYKLPTVVWQNDNQYSIGNPDIKKENFDAAEMYFSLNRNWSLSYGFIYGSSRVNVVMYQDPDRQGVFFTRPENTGNLRMHTWGLSYAGQITKFWYNNTGLSVQLWNEHTPMGSHNNTYLSLATNNNFNVTKNFGLRLNAYATTPYETVSYRSNSLFSVSGGANLSTLKDKLVFNLNYYYILYNRSEITSEGDGWKMKRKDLSAYPQVRLTVSWYFNFGQKIEREDMPSTGKSSRSVPTF